MDEDDVICVEMMRLGGCLAPKTPENSFSTINNNSSLDKYPLQQSLNRNSDHNNNNNPKDPSGNEINYAKNHSIATSLATSSTSYFEPNRFSFPNGQNIEYDPTETLNHSSHHNLDSDNNGRNVKSDLKVSFIDPNDNTDLSRISEAYSDLSTARTVAWNRKTNDSLHHHHTNINDSESYLDDQSNGHMTPNYSHDHPLQDERHEEVIINI